MHGEHQEPRARQALAEELDGVQPAEVRHVDVEHDHFGPIRFGEGQGRSCRADRADDADVIIGLDHRADALEHQGMVVADQDLDGGGSAHAGTGSDFLVR